jgi:hypothetical protein
MIDLREHDDSDGWNWDGLALSAAVLAWVLLLISVWLLP